MEAISVSNFVDKVASENLTVTFKKEGIRKFNGRIVVRPHVNGHTHSSLREAMNNILTVNGIIQDEDGTVSDVGFRRVLVSSIMTVEVSGKIYELENGVFKETP